MFAICQIQQPLAKVNNRKGNFFGRIALLDSMHPGTQERGFSAFGITQDDEMWTDGREQIDIERAQAKFFQAKRHSCWLVWSRGRQIFPLDQLRQHIDRWSGLSFPGSPCALDKGIQGFLHSGIESLLPHVVIDDWQRHLEMQFASIRTSPWHSYGNRGRDSFAQIRLHDIIEAQFQARANIIAYLCAKLGPAVRCQNQMDTIGKSACCNFDQFRLKLIKLLEKLREIIDDQENIYKGHILQLALLAPLAEGSHAINTAFTEEELALLDDFAHLAHHATNLIAVGLTAHGAHVRCLLKDAQ